jgi:hypothetical protein
VYISEAANGILHLVSDVCFIGSSLLPVAKNVCMHFLPQPVENASRSPCKLIFVLALDLKN